MLVWFICVLKFIMSTFQPLRQPPVLWKRSHEQDLHGIDSSISSKQAAWCPILCCVQVTWESAIDKILLSFWMVDRSVAPRLFHSKGPEKHGLLRICPLYPTMHCLLISYFRRLGKSKFSERCSGVIQWCSPFIRTWALEFEVQHVSCYANECPCCAQQVCVSDSLCDRTTEHPGVGFFREPSLASCHWSAVTCLFCLFWPPCWSWLFS